MSSASCGPSVAVYAAGALAHEEGFDFLRHYTLGAEKRVKLGGHYSWFSNSILMTWIWLTFVSSVPVIFTFCPSKP